ncbi:alpha/beta hydrolase [Streptomyces sp. 110]|uniref:Alpha/beta hydrolase n=1 Tax=Streptomyces endocoffeicus TaxID=2898945 RepID=A0ABS1PSL2_9ACTN|nr:alpha/beta hydrolase [Streptomyces endocoffeicus]MBL1115408.1 alpha/beta hydrolase [Streptomyces endocoffeicus]
MPFVLVHGATCVGGIWGRLGPLLYGDVLAVDLPGRGARAHIPLSGVTLDDCAEAVAEDIVQRNFTDQVTLVAHSFGGVVVPRVMALLPDRIRQVILLSAVVPPDGTPVADHIDARLRKALKENAVDGVYTFGVDAIRRRLCTDGDDDQIQYVRKHLVDDAAGLLTEPVDLSGYRLPIPRCYIKLALDWSYSPELQAEAAERTRSSLVTLNAGHMAMVSAPHQTAEVLNRLAFNALAPDAAT